MFLKGIDMNGNKIYLSIDLKSFYEIGRAHV